MLKENLVPKFERGEQVVVVDKEGCELHRGPLLGITQKRYLTLEFTIGDRKIDTYCGWKTDLFVLSAEKFDRHLETQNTREYSSVAATFVKYAAESLTDDERKRVDALVNELADISRSAAEREFLERNKVGASPESFQGMWGHHNLSRDQIDISVRKEMMFWLKMNYNKVYDELSSLEQDDSVIYIGSKEPLKQSALRNGTGHKDI